MIRNRLLLLIITVISSFQTFSQTESGPMRVEIEARAEVFNLIPCSEKGILVFYETINQVDQQNKSWFFVQYNTQLNTLWTKEIPILMDFMFQSYRFESDHIYLAFQKMSKARSEDFTFQLMKLDLLTGESVTYSIYTPFPAEIVRFEISANQLILGMNYGKEQAMILMKDLTTGSENTVKFADYPTFIKDIKWSTETGKIYTTLNVYLTKKESSLYLNSYDLNGQLARTITLTPPRVSERLMNGQIHLDQDENLFVLGTFNNLNGKSTKSETTGKGEQSEGFYIAGINEGNQKFLQTYGLLEFKNITNILNNQQLAAAGNLMKKQSKQGKEQSLVYDFLIHDLRVDGDNFVMVADAYYPEYRQISTMSYDFYGRPMPYYYTVFEGYRYFNAFVVGFNRQGELLWSNGIKIWDVQSMQLLQKTAVFNDGKELVIFYNHDGKIVSKVIEGYDDIGNVENTKIATGFTGDVLLENSQGNISHWYRDYFVAYGYQILQNNTKGGERRKVFYFNKIALN